MERMERVKNVLQRLQDLYFSRHQKSAIDVDLMLDYTRVMYADLLEWRKTFGEAPPTTEKADVNTEVTTRETQQVAAPAIPANAPADEVPQQETKEPPEEIAEAPAAAETETETEPAVQEVPSAGADKPQDEVYQPIVRDEPAPKPAPVTEETEPVVKTTPEKEPMAALQKEASGISFEPPSPPEARNDINEELVVEAPAVTTTTEEKPAPSPASIPLPEPAAVQGAKMAASRPQGNLFHAEKTPKDIRSLIGINDKYLFLNELFSNHKSNYEETLDQLNLLSNAQQAEDWIRTKVAQARKWDKDDATVESFYSVVKRHFSEI